jgi:hypothetical protein
LNVFQVILEQITSAVDEVKKETLSQENSKTSVEIKVDISEDVASVELVV